MGFSVELTANEEDVVFVGREGTFDLPLEAHLQPFLVARHQFRLSRQRAVQAGDHRFGDVDRALPGVAVGVQALQQPGHVDDPVVVHVGALEEVHRRDPAVAQGVAQVHAAHGEIDALAGDVP